MRHGFWLLLTLSAALHGAVAYLAGSEVRPPRLPLRSGETSVEVRIVVASSPRPAVAAQPLPAPPKPVEKPLEPPKPPGFVPAPPAPREPRPLPKPEQRPPDGKKALIAKQEKLPSPSAPAPARTATDARPRGVRSAARLIGNASPPYPPLAVQLGMEGEVIVRLAISATGAIDKATLKRSSGHALLDRHTLEFARTLRAEPQKEDGKPVAAECDWPVNYRLQ